MCSKKNNNIYTQCTSAWWKLTFAHCVLVEKTSFTRGVLDEKSTFTRGVLDEKSKFTFGVLDEKASFTRGVLDEKAIYLATLYSTSRNVLPFLDNWYFLPACGSLSEALVPVVLHPLMAWLGLAWLGLAWLGLAFNVTSPYIHGILSCLFNPLQILVPILCKTNLQKHNIVKPEKDSTAHNIAG